VSPDTIFVTLPPGGFTTETITLENPGTCDIDWTATVNIVSDNPFNLKFEYPAAVGGGEAGIETDGSFIYTTKWNGNEFYKYSMNGTFIETFTIDGVSGIRDLAWNGTYFYGSPASLTVFEMDFDNQALVGTFTAPTDVRAIAYNDYEDTFYANNWSSDIIEFDYSGQYLGSFAVGFNGNSYYGFAYDNFTGEYLWGYAQAGASQNELIQINLPDGSETGFTIDIGSVLNGNVTSIAGGLFTATGLSMGSFIIGGLVQNEWLWGLGYPECPWLFISSTSGTLASGETNILEAYIETTSPEGVHEADIKFITEPETGEHIVHVVLNIVNNIPPSDLYFSVNCTDVELCWDMPPNCYPDSFSVYINGQPPIYTTGNCYTFTGPGFFDCYVTAWYSGIESGPSDMISLEVPWPDESEPGNFVIDTVLNNIVYTSWNEPEGCAEPDGYNVYRDGELLNDTIVLQTFYADTFDLSSGVYEYYTTAVYSFGESDSSNVETLMITGSDEIFSKSIKLFPVPASEYVNISSGFLIQKIRVMDNTGQMVLENEINTWNYRIDVSGFERGIYFILIKSEKVIAIRKVVID
jgi:hypothetical protein